MLLIILIGLSGGTDCNIHNIQVQNLSISFQTNNPCEGIFLKSENSTYSSRTSKLSDAYIHIFEIEQHSVYHVQQPNRRHLQTDSLNCYPYGQRISLGYYFTYQNDSSSIVDIAFNTLAYCNYSYITISSGSFSNTVPVTQIVTLNMTQIYENFSTVHYDYVTYTNIVQLGVQNIPGDGRIYNYSIFGDQNDFIGPFMFRVPPKYGNQSKKFIFFGDMDANWVQNVSNYTFNWLQARTTEQYINEFDILVFEGDMAYDLESQNCQMGEYWLRNMSAFTSNYPFMVAPGNHDSGNNSDYPFLRRTFMAPQNQSLNTPEFYNSFYSFDLGLAHFIFYNPDWIVYDTENSTFTDAILAIFENDLIQAQANRENVPWIIVNAHYPMYCSDEGDYQCSQNHIALNGFAQLFTQYGVEMYMSAHQHNYERDAPFINNVSGVFTTDGPAQHLIQNSNAPVYIIEGAAGNAYFMATSDYPVQPYTVMQSEQRGVGIITIINSTHLYFEHVNTYNNSLIDYVMVVKDRTSTQKKSRGWVYILVGVVLFVITMSAFLYLWRRETLKRALLS